MSVLELLNDLLRFFAQQVSTVIAGALVRLHGVVFRESIATLVDSADYFAIDVIHALIASFILISFHRRGRQRGIYSARGLATASLKCCEAVSGDQLVCFDFSFSHVQFSVKVIVYVSLSDCVTEGLTNDLVSILDVCL